LHRIFSDNFILPKKSEKDFEARRNVVRSCGNRIFLCPFFQELTKSKKNIQPKKIQKDIKIFIWREI